MNRELQAFRAVDLNWTHALQNVWTDPDYQVDELHRAIADRVMDDFQRGTRNLTDNPIGRVVVGQAGAGKTHLIGTLRRRVWQAGGWFVLLDIVGISDFWRTAAHCFVNALMQPMANGRTQCRAVLSEIAKRVPLDSITRIEVGRWEAKPDRTRLDTVDLFLKLLRRLDTAGTMRNQDIIRAFLLLDAEDMEANNVAYGWLQGLDVDENRRELKFMGPPPAFPELVRGMIWIVSLAGPLMIAVDQIDAIVGASNALMGGAPGDDDEAVRKARHVIEMLAGGLMDLHDLKRRAMTVVSCLQETWPIIRQKAVQSAAQRFEELPGLNPINDRRTVEHLIGARLGKGYAEAGFRPRYPTWPFRPEAIASAIGLLPRQILIRCQNHRQRCVEKGEVFECASLASATPTAAPAPASSELDRRFRELSEAADISGLLDPEGEDAAAASLLVHACELYLGHVDLPESLDAIVKPDPNPKKPSLHARLSFVFHDEGDREQHYCFRALGHANAIAFQTRLRAAMTAAGIDVALKFRHLFILRRDALPGGAKTKDLVQQFEKAGGAFVDPSDGDLRAFVALRAMAEADLPGFEAWLLARKPLFDTALFQLAGLAPPAFLSGVVVTPPRPEAAPAPVAPVARQRPTPAPPPVSPAAKPTVAPLAAAPPPTDQIPLGRRFERGALGDPVTLARSQLSTHVAIVAGSGSGKTVLLRRIVEEAALLGIPAIVLDVNNDLSRLGDSWPARPPSFSDEDAAKAEAYRARADVVVWTPGVGGGQPLYLSLLPDFASANDEDDRAQAVGMAQATLEPYLGGAGQKAALKRGVLADALRRFAKGGGGTLDDLIRLLSEPPDDLSQISDAGKLAAEMADQLRAAIATNPLLKADGPTLDPARLFSGEGGKTRISVINLAGLASDPAKQAFVNQLQMTLFTWIKKHPSPAGRLYIMDEAQNFAPSQLGTACKRSTLALASQARKYGLGMIFATQHPKGIDNAILSNCATHFYGRVASPTAIIAVEDLVASKGGSASDIGKLTTGEFYFATEGLPRPLKIRAPLCLSWHPPNPPTPEEVAQKARSYRERAAATA
jgi:hypothetical protein